MLHVDSPAATKPSSAHCAGVSRNCRQEEGQGLVEYALILAFLAVLVIAAINHLQPAINSVLNTSTATLTTFARVDLVGNGSSCYPATTSVGLTSGGTVQWGIAGSCTGAGKLVIIDNQGNTITTSDINTFHPTYNYVVTASGRYTFHLQSNAGVVGTITVQ